MYQDMHIQLTCDRSLWTHEEIPRTTCVTCKTMSTMPACTDDITHFERRDTWVDFHDFADGFVAWDTEVTFGETLASGCFVSVQWIQRRNRDKDENRYVALSECGVSIDESWVRVGVLCSCGTCEDFDCNLVFTWVFPRHSQTLKLTTLLCETICDVGFGVGHCELDVLLERRRSLRG